MQGDVLSRARPHVDTVKVATGVAGASRPMVTPSSDHLSSSSQQAGARVWQIHTIVSQQGLVASASLPICPTCDHNLLGGLSSPPCGQATCQWKVDIFTSDKSPTWCCSSSGAFSGSCLLDKEAGSMLHVVQLLLCPVFVLRKKYIVPFTVGAVMFVVDFETSKGGDESYAGVSPPCCLLAEEQQPTWRACLHSKPLVHLVQPYESQGLHTEVLCSLGDAPHHERARARHPLRPAVAQVRLAAARRPGAQGLGARGRGARVP
jgi:hypothetical protein